MPNTTTSEYNLLIYAATMFAIFYKKKLLPQMFTCLKNNKPADEVLWDIFAECRLHEASPAVRRFYDDLKGVYGNEYKLAE
jgi:hypothetical protein